MDMAKSIDEIFRLVKMSTVAGHAHALVLELNCADQPLVAFFDISEKGIRMPELYLLATTVGLGNCGCAKQEEKYEKE
jgi:hypothetical protein